MVDTDAAAPGWDAITASLSRLYPGIEPVHFGTLLKWELGGPDPLDGISIYQRDDHWHFITYGMSELYGKESETSDVSGWGFEFTFRLTRAAGESEPPIWAANFLQNLARYVFSSGNAFDVGHHVDLNGPISLSHPDTVIRAITFAEDPELGGIDTANGALRFLQVVGLSLDEYAIIERWNAVRLLEVLAPELPLLVTDLDRRNLADDPQVVKTVEAGITSDGSSTGSLYVEEASWQLEPAGLLVISLGANPAERVGRLLAARLPFGLGVAVDGPKGGVLFVGGERVRFTEVADGYVEVELTEDALTDLVAVLRPESGVYRLPATPQLIVEIKRSFIRDRDGNVVREIG